MRSCECIHKVWVVAGIISIALLYVLYPIFYVPSLDSWRSARFDFDIKTDSNASRPVNVPTKKILFWNTMFGDEAFYFGKGDIFEKCHGVARNCWATHERSNIVDFDAILFHGSELSILDIPWTRRKLQNYVFVNLESPENRPIPDSRFDNGYFNLTMTYRLDSDLIWSYADIRSLEDGSVVAPRHDPVWHSRPFKVTDIRGTENSNKAPEAGSNTLDNTLKIRQHKSKTAIWFVSNCGSKSGREKYIAELATYVDVDIYGRCGKEAGCPPDRDCFHEVVEPDYYFYLSFENSMCQDYVTEKLYKALKHDVVPVVYGGANYSLFAPPRSYINALDFDGPRELAMYLKRLIARPSEYEKYFEWKKIYEVVNSNDRVICELCEYLHDKSRAKMYSSLSAWYRSDKCPLQEKLKNLPYLTRKN